MRARIDECAVLCVRAGVVNGGRRSEPGGVARCECDWHQLPGVAARAIRTIAGVGPLAIVGATLFAGLVAGIAVGLLGKVVKHAVRWVIIFGVVLTVASLSAPLAAARASVHVNPNCVDDHARHDRCAGHFGLARGIWTDDRAVLA